MTEVFERRWYGYVRIDAEPPPAAIDETVTYEQWIGLLYACAVFRGVLVHPPRWP